MDTKRQSSTLMKVRGGSSAELAPLTDVLYAASCRPSRHCHRLVTLADFSSAFWRNTFLALVLTFGVYKISGQYAPAAQHPAVDEEHDPEDKPIEHADESKPYLTRYLAYHMPRSGIWKERNDKHLELTYQQAEDKGLLQDAQRPKIRRLRNPGLLFDNASPNGECARQCGWQ